MKTEGNRNYSEKIVDFRLKIDYIKVNHETGGRNKMLNHIVQRNAYFYGYYR